MQQSTFTSSLRFLAVFFKIALFAALLLQVSETAAATWHVKPDGNDGDAGTSWATAFQTLQKALDEAVAGDQIWVAAGTYVPTVPHGGTGDNDKTFFINKDVKIYGGFAGTETDLSQRNWVANPTILSGDIGGQGDFGAYEDNAYHVVSLFGCSPAMLLDGFTIKNGRAVGYCEKGRGGGIYNNRRDGVSDGGGDDGGGDGGGGGAGGGDDGGGGAGGGEDGSGGGAGDGGGAGGGGGAGAGDGSGAGGGDSGGGGSASQSSGAGSTGGGEGSDDEGGDGGSGGGGGDGDLGDDDEGGDGGGDGVGDGGGGDEGDGDENCEQDDENTGGVASPTIANCTFTRNWAYKGGAFYNDSRHVSEANPTFINCTFFDNSANSGNALFSKGDAGVPEANMGEANPSLINCVFIKNFGSSAIQIEHSSPTLTNCSFSGNNYFAIVSLDGSPILTNCILWGNRFQLNVSGGTVTVNHSIVQGGYPGTGNLDADPLFVIQPNFINGDVPVGDLHLQACSPAIDAGADLGAPSDDLDGNVRPFDAIPNVPGNYDMGAYEYQALALPMAICNDNLTLPLDNTGNADITPADINNGSTGVCGGLSVLPNAFTCEHVGENAVILTASDLFGNESTCTTTVTVVDDINPVALCKNATVQLDADGIAYLTPSLLDNGSSDACGILSLELSDYTLNCSNVGNNLVTLTVTDVNGEQSQCGANVVVQDNIFPTALCQNATVELGIGGDATITAATVDNGSFDNCAVVSLSLSQYNFNCSNVGGNMVTLTVTGSDGNQQQCDALVEILDVTPPDMACHNATVQLDASGNASITWASIDGGSHDACAIQNLSLSQSSFTCADLGPNAVTLTATDFSGNANSCTETVTVEDNVAPQAICQSALTVTLNPATGSFGITPAQVNNGSNDNCAIALSLDVETFTCSDLGDHVVTLTVADPGGNESTCTTTVTVNQYAFSVSVPACQQVFFGYAPAACATIETSVGGGSAPFSYAWSTGATSEDISFCATTPDNPAPFSVTVTDANGCTTAETAQIKVTDVRCGNNMNKVQLCHNGNNTNCVSANAVPAHLAHGDYLGACGAADPCANALILPPGVLDFNAVSSGGQGLQVDLSWITNTGKTDERYEVERSAGGIDFQPIAAGASARNDVETRLYRHSDPQPQEGTWFYRLKVIRKDGSFAWTEPVQVRLFLPDDFTVFPNPANERLQVSLKSSAGQAADLQIVNAQGLVVSERHVEALPVEALTLDLAGLKDGLYWLNVQVAGKRARSVKFVVAKTAAVRLD